MLFGIFQEVIFVIVSVPIEGIECCATYVSGLIVVFCNFFHEGIIGLFDILAL